MKLKNIALGLVTLRFAAYLYKKNKNKLPGKWIIKEGWFGSQEIFLEKFDEAAHKQPATVLIFEENDTLLQQQHDPQILDNGNSGKLYFNAATWKLDDNDITFDIKGGHIASDTFHYTMVYTITLITSLALILKKKRQLIFEEKSMLMLS